MLSNIHSHDYESFAGSDRRDEEHRWRSKGRPWRSHARGPLWAEGDHPLQGWESIGVHARPKMRPVTGVLLHWLLTEDHGGTFTSSSWDLSQRGEEGSAGSCAGALHTKSYLRRSVETGGRVPAGGRRPARNGSALESCRERGRPSWSSPDPSRTQDQRLARLRRDRIQ